MPYEHSEFLDEKDYWYVRLINAQYFKDLFALKK